MQENTLNGKDTDDVQKLRDELKLAIKEKEAMVVRYAISEKNLYKQKVTNDRLEKHLNQVLKDYNDLKSKANNSKCTNKTLDCKNNTNDLTNVVNKDIAEIKASLILKKHQKETLEQKIKSLFDELANSKQNCNKIQEENAKLKITLNNVEKERDSLQVNVRNLQAKADEHLQVLNQVNELQSSIDKHKSSIVDLNDQLNQLQLENDELHENNSDLLEKERELSKFVEKAVNENCYFKVAYRIFINKIDQKDCELKSLRRHLDEKEKKLLTIKDDLYQEYKNLDKENDDLKNKLNIHQMEYSVLLKKLEDNLDQNAILERKIKCLESIKKEQNLFNHNMQIVRNQQQGNALLEKMFENETVDNNLIAIIAKLQNSSIEKSEKIDFLQDQIKILNEKIIRIKQNK